ncbi:MAG: NAD-dependent epimerase/dehydratase family protein [Candidatus Thermoplasmatota archaeon]|nr:NAD-dependent epimerase/dehydratase family protein [Candidatus Thermoplasmatota archaeon]
MLALVTGGTGFIGSHLVDELSSQGYTVRVLQRTSSNPRFLEGKPISPVMGDLTDRESLVRACQYVDVVYHIAALPRDWGPRKTFFEVNVDGTRNLLDACVVNKVPRFVFMSSAAVYGFPKTRQPLQESFPKHPTLNYGESKLAAEALLWGYGMNHDIAVSAVRSPVVLGPRDHLITLFLIHALQRKRLFYIGDGNQQISLSDGRDVARCLRLAGESSISDNQPYNVKSFDSTPRLLMRSFAEQLRLSAPEKCRSYLQAYVLASLVEGFWMLARRKNPPFTRHKVRVMGTSRRIDSSKAAQELKYVPRYRVLETITDSVSWYKTLNEQSLLTG